MFPQAGRENTVDKILAKEQNKSTVSLFPKLKGSS